ncbi:hypothetical protein PIB30_080548 [Stylosanthes scabra]|uniref:Uncharacterized protein n=1 Tax=Stylosanthes scabra TaxID=79078 RepID=A0ABU6YTB0_9FABA|nr:hypothetical protein [Stylosanthes scabra]
MPDEDDPEFTNGDIEGLEHLMYTDNAMPSYPNNGETWTLMLICLMYVVMEEPSSTASDDGLPLGVFDVGVGSLDDDYAM